MRYVRPDVPSRHAAMFTDRNEIDLLEWTDDFFKIPYRIILLATISEKRRDCVRYDKEIGRLRSGGERSTVEDTNDDREQCNTFDQSGCNDHRCLNLVRDFRLTSHAFDS